MSEDGGKAEFLARDYQSILAQQALDSNKILFLPTGSGKTFIAIMVLKKLFHLLKPEFLCGGKRAVFLVNTVALVEQQADVLIRHLPVDDVGKYSGDMNLDFWDKKVWTEEFSKFQVLVMTAEILNQLLLKKYISLSNLALIILDECHHAVEDHPMRQIMRLFENCSKELQPKVIGLTATLLNGTPKSLPRVEEEVKKLEITLHSTIATVDSWETVKQFSTKPTETYAIYRETLNNLLLTQICHKIDKMFLICRNFNFLTDKSYNVSRIQGFIPLKSGKKNELSNLVVQVTKQLGMLGPYGCHKTLHAVFVSLRLLHQNMIDEKSKLTISSINCLLFAISRQLESIMAKVPDEMGLRAYHFSSPKVHLLLCLLEDHYKKCSSGTEPEPMKALIFVEERMTAKILCSVLANIARNPQLSFIKPGFMVGGTYNPLSETWEGSYRKHKNDDVVQRFRDGELNVIVSTDVLEEGIDIAQCNMVVRFDLIKSYRSYIQSKGRARHMSSLFFLMVTEAEKKEYQNKMLYYKQIEEVLERLLVGHTDDRLSPTEQELELLYESEIEPYYTPVGSKVTLTSAIQLVNGYCMFLAHDRYSKLTPTYHMKKGKDGETITVAIQLPKLSPMQDIVQGQPMPSLKSAKRAAALEICKKLHQVGELNDFLMPNENCLPEQDMVDLLPLWEQEDDSEYGQKAGTTKRTRPYNMHKPLCFDDSYPKAQNRVYLHLVEIYPVYEKPPETNNRKFVTYSVLNEKKNFAIVSSKQVTTVCQFPVFSKFGELRVTLRNNMQTTYITEEELMDIKLFHWSLFTSLIPVAKSYVVFSENSYLIAPVLEDTQGNIYLDWTAMKVCCQSNESRISSNAFKCIVSPAHRGVSSISEIYIVTRVCSELNGTSRFPERAYKSYEDYYLKKHGFRIQDLSQPLLEVQPIKLLSNDLLPRSASSLTASEATHFPIEACKMKCADGCLFLKACTLPSVLHRLERFLKADELRRKIALETEIGKTIASYDTICKLWGKTSWPILTEKKSHNSTNSLSVSFVKSKLPHSRLKISSSKPWGDIDEPADVERNFDTVSLEDIDKYNKFVQTKVSSKSAFRTGTSRQDMIHRLPCLSSREGIIKLLGNVETSNLGPHPCHILEATTAASADDLWNLERLETLGDSFLKFAVSFFLYKRFPNVSEGKLTQIKGQILGNRNLFYCAKEKKLGDYMKVHKVVPSEAWIPPCFSAPKEVLVENLSYLLRQNLHLSKEEQFNGKIKLSSLEALRTKKSVDQMNQQGRKTIESMDFLSGLQLLADKTVADCVEALIGAFLQTCGPKSAVKFLVWMRVLPDDAEILLQERLEFKAPLQHSYSTYSDDNDSYLSSRIGYKFKNKSLLTEALTHASSPSSASDSYERLEFVGDAVLDFLITAHIFENCGNLNPGQLTDLRSALVNNITFACLTVRYGFYKFLSVGSPALLEAIDRFVQFQEGRKHVIDEEVLILLEEKECKLAETVDVPKALGDLFEALIGAIFIDTGKNFSAVWKVIYRLMKTEICNFSKNVPKQVVRRLYEAVGQHEMSFRVSDATHEMGMEQVFVVLNVRVGDEERSYNGFGVNKVQAKKSAAKLALRDLKMP